jgi:hypothetical protein
MAPITAAATNLRHALDDFSRSDPLVWVAVAVLAALAASTLLVRRRLRTSAPG